MSLLTELQARTDYKVNIVIDIDGTKYSKHAVDSGLTVATENQVLVKTDINPTVVDLKRARQKITTATVDILDKDEIFSLHLGSDTSVLIGKTLEIYVGLVGTAVGGSFDWADYEKINAFTIRDISKKDNVYTIRTESRAAIGSKPLFNVSGNLDSTITDSATSIVVNNDSDDFASSGYVQVGEEIFSYTSTTFLSGQTTFAGVIRGVLGSTATAHTEGTECFEMIEVEDNPIEILLQLLISSGGTGTYDVLKDGLGIDQSLIDVTSFEAIRDTFFLTDNFRIHLSNIEDGLKFIEQELLLANNIRLIDNVDNEKIGLAILDQADLSADVEELDSTNTKARPRWKATRVEIQNTLTVKWDWSPGLKQFKKTNIFTDADSITKFGTKSGPTIEFKGIKSDLSGDTIVSAWKDRFFARFATPQVQIEVDCFGSSALSINVGDKVRYTSNELPKEGSGLGFSSIVEVLKNSWDLDRMLIKRRLVFTSYTNFRTGVIAPSEIPSSVASQSQFDVADGTLYKAGYALRLWDVTNSVYFSDPVNVIDSVVGNTITMTDAWATTLSANTRLKFADYNDSSTAQKSKYAYVVDGVTETFDDGSPGYQIIL